jgi:hypothetical protein
MGKNKDEKPGAGARNGKTQELEEEKRISKGYFKNNPTKPK